MPVVATCTDCHDEHDLGDRSAAGELTVRTTACPSCSSTSYTSEAIGGTVSKPEAERIRDAVEEISGVGEETVERLEQRFGMYVELEQASVDELTQVKNVGKTVAERIQEAT